MTRPIQASLDLQVMKQNLAIVRRAAPEARVWSVVKANATPTATVLNACGARWAPQMVSLCSTLKRRLPCVSAGGKGRY